MSQELKITEAISFANGRLSYTLGQTQYPVTQTTQGMHNDVWIVGTSEEDMAVGDIATNGWLLLMNLDPTNFVKWGPKNAGSMVEAGRLKPNEPPTLIRLAPGVTIRAIADTASCKVQIALFND